MGVEPASLKQTIMGDAPDAAAVKEAFLFFDKEGKEFLTSEEFIKMVQSLGQTPTKAQLTKLLEEHAPNNEVKMDAVEKMMPEIAKTKKTRKEVLDAFRVFDNRSDDHITVDNFRQMMGQVGEKLDAKEVDEAVAKALEVAAGETENVPAIKYPDYVDWMMGKE